MKTTLLTIALCTLTYISQAADFEINRTMNETEMQCTVKKQALVKNNRGNGAKWVGKGQIFKVANDADYMVVFTMKAAYRDSLGHNTIDPNLVTQNAEVGNPNKILIKSNEPNAYGIGVDRLAEFNRNIKSTSQNRQQVKSIQVYVWQGGKWEVCRKAICTQSSAICNQ